METQKRLLKYVLKYKTRLILAMILGALMAACTLVMSVMIKWFVMAGSSESSIADMWLVQYGVERGWFTQDNAAPALMWIVAGFGTTVVAAFAVGRRLQMVAFMPAFGLAAASAALVGQNLGAKKPGRAQKSALISMGMAFAIMESIGLATFILAPRLVSAFNQEPEVVAAGTSYLRIVTFGYAFAACGIVLGRAISGAGDTVPPMVITLVGLWFLQVPLAYALAQWTGLAEQGVWWANVAASVALATMTGTYFFIGRWKKRKL